MKKLILSITCLAFFAACNNNNRAPVETTAVEAEAVSNTAEADAPVFKFEKETFDFGQITEGEKVSYDFKFKNTGNSPLIITSATATCGCTVPQYPKEPVAPGAEGVLRVVFDSAGKPGMQNKVITITANTVPEITQINILGNVVNSATARN